MRILRQENVMKHLKIKMRTEFYVTFEKIKVKNYFYI